MINGYDFEDVFYFAYKCVICDKEISKMSRDALVEIDITKNPEKESCRIFYCLSCGKQVLLNAQNGLEEMRRDLEKMSEGRK